MNAKTSAPGQLELVNFIKGTAITAIVLFHLIYDYMDVPGIIATASKLAGSGIHGFFICSGFGLTLSQLRKPASPLQFLKRRFGKIYFPYILVVLLSTALPFLYTGSHRLAAVLSHVFLFKMFLPAYNISFGAQFWFVSTIFQFYVVFPLLEKFRSALKEAHFLLICCCLSLGWMAFTAVTGLYEERIWGSFFLQYAWEFGLGMCLGARFYKDRTSLYCPKVPVVAVLTAISLALYAVMALKGGFLTAFNDVFGATAFCGICVLVYQAAFLRPLMTWINTFSYELYLVHILVFSTCEALLSPILPNHLWCLLALLLAYLCALLYSKALNTIRQSGPPA